MARVRRDRLLVFPEEERRAWIADTDRDWTEVASDPAWEPESGWGGFSFLDAISFRYYLPAAMTKAVREERSCGLVLHLNLATEGDGSHEWSLGKWSLLDAKQRACVARFLRYGMRREEALWGVPSAPEWHAALGSYSHQF